MHVRTLRSRRCASSRPAWSRSASEGVCCEASPQSGHPAARPWSEACCHPDTAGAGASGQKVELGIRPPHQLSGVLVRIPSAGSTLGTPACTQALRTSDNARAAAVPDVPGSAPQLLEERAYEEVTVEKLPDKQVVSEDPARKQPVVESLRAKCSSANARSVTATLSERRRS